MHEVDFRKLQEACADLLRIKDEIAKAAYKLFKAFIKAGFTEKQVLILVIKSLFK